MTCSEVIMLNENDQEVPDQFDECSYSCDICMEKFSWFEDLGVHRTASHGMGAVRMRQTLESYNCDICPLMYNSEAELEDHVESCHMDYI